MRKEPVMKKIRFVGLDVHGATIAAAVAEPDGEVRFLGKIPNSTEAVRKLVKRLGPVKELRVCYEAGPCGYVLYWQLVGLGVKCEVVAPTLIPVKAGDRVKTDRRDAEKLARSYRSGDLTAVWIPDAAHEALRDVVRAREAAKKDQLRARHRLSKFLLRRGLRTPAKMAPWGGRYMKWVSELRFEHLAQEATHLDYLGEVEHAAQRLVRLERSIDEAVEQAPAAMRAVIGGLQAMRGIAKISAVTVATEIGSFSRFVTPRPLMGYSGIVSREDSSGERTRRGAITKAGNAHLRRIAVEAAWAYRHRPSVGETLRRRQKDLAPEVIEIAWKAQHRLHNRYRRLAARGKASPKVVTAVARELLGFLWHIGVTIERSHAA
jgi:transposase